MQTIVTICFYKLFDFRFIFNKVCYIQTPSWSDVWWIDLFILLHVCIPVSLLFIILFLTIAHQYAER